MVLFDPNKDVTTISTKGKILFCDLSAKKTARLGCFVNVKAVFEGKLDKATMKI